MKTLILITSMMALGLMGVGCSKSNSGSTNNGNVNTTGVGGTNPVIIDPSNGGSGIPSFSSGFTADLNTTLAAMRAYTSIPGNFTALNNPQNIKINVNLAQVNSGRYGGTITISYFDNGIQRTGTFEAGMGTNPYGKGMYDNDKLQSEYNYWFNWEGKLVFTAFFEDSFGAITLTLEPETASGGGNDAEPLNVKYKGTVYFKNFTSAKVTPYRSCWHIYTGAHDCRSNVIQTKCGLFPGVEAGYTLLGTFTNVDIKQAFNIE